MPSTSLGDRVAADVPIGSAANGKDVEPREGDVVEAVVEVVDAVDDDGVTPRFQLPSSPL
jgi:hypothetical protein